MCVRIMKLCSVLLFNLIVLNDFVHMKAGSTVASALDTTLAPFGYSNVSDEIVIPEKPDFSLTLSAQPDPFKTKDPTTQAKVRLRNDLFGGSDILYYALLVARESFSKPPENGSWDMSSRWPDIPNWENEKVPYQVTPVKWNPFRDVVYPSKGIQWACYVLGDGKGEDTRYWNKPLEEKTRYALKIRAFTATGFQDSDVLVFETLEKLPVLKITSILLGIWLITGVAVCLSIIDYEWIKRLNVTFGSKKSKDYFSPVPESLSHKAFLQYAEDLLNNQGRLGNEFHLLGTLSSDVSTLCLHAQRVDNRKKNRYGNILPFDMTRVKLSIVDDDPSTDYINASFIKGYTREVEYIACQGPQKETCHDFYRMILEQNVEIIVMLTQLYENCNEKCFKYYPEEGQFARFNDVNVFCREVIDCGFYKKRTLEITKVDKRVVVTQFHYNKWKDFVGPANTSDMLDFCDIVGKNRQSCIVVHCSAGAGRTGTFIAIDVLLQRVRNNNKLNVFDTVLKLRQQRVGMVQTEAQLRYIYRCISDAVDRYQCPDGSTEKEKRSVT